VRPTSRRASATGVFPDRRRSLWPLQVIGEPWRRAWNLCMTTDQEIGTKGFRFRLHSANHRS
jgi:hypothetical protein